MRAIRAAARGDETWRAGAALGLILAVACLGACGSSDSDDDGKSGAGGTANGGGGAGNGGGGAETGFLACPDGVEFQLVGELDGEGVDVTDAPTTGGFSQGSNPPGPHFRVPSMESEDSAQLIVVFLTWAAPAANGEVVPIEGWLRLPSGSPRQGETLCAGQGSEMTIPRSEEKPTVGDFQFRVVGLSGGSDCSTPVSGELRGCWRN